MRLQEQLERFTSSVDFDRIVVLYFTLIFVFGTLFFLLSYTEGNGLYVSETVISHDFGGYLNALYFSFVTSTSLGYGDIHPLGVSRFFSIMEVFISLLIFGVLVSKIISVKQEKILEEIYEISFQSRVTRVISGLYNFRAEIDRLAGRLSEGTLTKEETDEELQNIETNMHLLSSYLMDISRIMSKEERKHLKKLSDFRADIILDNLHTSVSKIEDLLGVLKAKKIEWKNESTLRNMTSIFGTTENICTECLSGDYENVQEVIAELKKHSNSLRKSV